MKKTALGGVQRTGDDGDQCKPLCRQKSDPMNDYSAFASSLVPTLRLKIQYTIYQKEERSLLYSVHEAAEEKAHGASGIDHSSSGGKEPKMPQNPSLNSFSDDIKDCIGFFHVFLFSGRV